MTEMPEIGCKQCGRSLTRVDMAPLNQKAELLPSNKCEECGHDGPLEFSFYGPNDLRARVQAKWSAIDMKEFRLDPESYVANELNPWLGSQGMGHAIFEGAGKALHLKWERVSDETG